jgi:cyclopropane fatty-acyl-phospholipid synthase-like methyltransferase
VNLSLKKGELFLRVMNAKWEKAREEAQCIKKLLELLGVRENSLILDLGCGNGRISVNLGKL